MSQDSLAERVAIVTRGSRGIGRGIAIELARAGATVVFTYRSSSEGADGSWYPKPTTIKLRAGDAVLAQ